ncbi:hypothetical protein PLUA15_400005 [Pseudomonas lundensis]|uniref:Uncharacterized protein n=1 Tax=Pseudomonas lundensis TaxID=86185 RepID=A0AAX2H9R3_9PSED|nr:hypothetical protein PLUA15_400005 [Pseudomonas lundensis]
MALPANACDAPTIYRRIPRSIGRSQYAPLRLEDRVYKYESLGRLIACNTGHYQALSGRPRP